MIEKHSFIVSGSNGKPISADMHYDDAKTITNWVVYVHGFNGFKDWGNGDLMASYFTNAGLGFVKFNFSHNGTTPDYPEEFTDLEAYGQNNFSKQIFDLEQVFVHLEKIIPFHSHNFHLIGHSMGGGVSILFAAKHPHRLKSLLTWAAIDAAKTPWGKWSSDKMDVWRETKVAYYFNGRTGQHLPLYYQLYEDYINNQKQLDIKLSAETIGLPWLLCHGTNDEAVDISVAQQFEKVNDNIETYYPETNHTFGRVHPHLSNVYPSSFDELLRKSVQFIIKHSS